MLQVLLGLGRELRKHRVTDIWGLLEGQVVTFLMELSEELIRRRVLVALLPVDVVVGLICHGLSAHLVT